MRRRIQGLHEADRSAPNEVPDGLYLVRVTRVQYGWHAQKPFYIVCFAVIEPKERAGHFISGRLYCTPKALWKLSWFLRDFGYDTESLGRDEIDEKNLVGLRGVVKISRRCRKWHFPAEPGRLRPEQPVGRTADRVTRSR